MKFSTKAKLAVKEIVPPFLLKICKKLNKSEEYGFFGDYSSWEDAMKDSVGYDSDIILNKVKNSLLQVKEGKAIYERDSVLFDKIEYSFPVLAALLKIALENDGKLSVLDFGGSLGSSYYQCKDFLGNVKELHWSIVEQPKFVECGKQHFKNNQLKFYKNIETCLKYEKPDVILLSSVIQYLEKPYEFLHEIIQCSFRYIIVDRTGFIFNKSQEILSLQKVDPIIYKASYPAWFLNENKFLSVFQKKYHIILEFQGSDKVNFVSEFKGFVFKKKYEN
jgi:putative methyltransferase (TIGR04325 family)